MKKKDAIFLKKSVHNDGVHKFDRRVLLNITEIIFDFLRSQPVSERETALDFAGSTGYNIETSGCGEAWYRAWFGSKRPRVRIPTLRP